MIHHLSHIDLDGYGCQAMTNKAFHHHDIEFYNVDYRDISEMLDTIKNHLEKDDTLIITDLNLDAAQAAFVDELSSTFNLELILIDHHGTGQAQADMYDWYNLNTSISATLATYNRFMKGFVEQKLYFYIAYMIDTYDMWRKERIADFNQASLVSSVIYNLKLDSKYSTEIRIDIIEELFRMFSRRATTTEVESETPAAITEILKTYASRQMAKLMDDPGICSSVKIATFPAEEIEFHTISLDDLTIKVSFDVHSSTFQYSSDFLLGLKENQNVVMMNVNTKNKSVSYRSRNEKASNVAKCFKGGGHLNASGSGIELEDDLTTKDILEYISETITLKLLCASK